MLLDVPPEALPGGTSPSPGTGDDAVARATSAIREAMPASLRSGEFLGLEPWQWVALGVLLLAGLAAAAALRRIAGGVLARWLAREGHASSAERVSFAVGPLAHCAAGVIWLRAVPLTGLAGVPLDALLVLVRLYVVVSAAWLGLRLSDLAGDRLHQAWQRTPSRLDDLLGPLVRKALKVLTVALAVIYGLRSLGVEVGPLVASLGLGGLAVAFAAKDTIENFFGSVAVIADRPFEVGDTISVAGVEGQVVEVGFRSTRLRTSRGTLLTLPNAALVRATVERLGDGSRQVIGFTLRLDPATSPERIVAVRDALREMVLAHPRTVDEETDVRLASISEGSFDIFLRVVLEAGTKSTERQEREVILLRVLEIARAMDVQLAGPKPAPAAPPPAPAAPSVPASPAGKAPPPSDTIPLS